MAELNLSTDPSDPAFPWAELLAIIPHVLWAAMLVTVLCWIGPTAIRRALQRVTKVGVAGVEVEFRTAIEAAAVARGKLVSGFIADRAARRLAGAGDLVTGAHLLWVDDAPQNNLLEAKLLRDAGAQLVTVKSTRSALAKLGRLRVDLVISDIRRGRDAEAGVKMAHELPRRGHGAPVIFYIGRADGTPAPGAFGITDRPDELIHLVLDVLARVRG